MYSLKFIKINGNNRNILVVNIKLIDFRFILKICHFNKNNNNVFLLKFTSILKHIKNSINNQPQFC